MIIVLASLSAIASVLGFWGWVAVHPREFRRAARMQLDKPFEILYLVKYNPSLLRLFKCPHKIPMDFEHLMDHMELTEEQRRRALYDL